jgi:general stress protein YciG
VTDDKKINGKETPPSRVSLRGFASMTPKQRSAISRLGGLAVKPENRSFSKNRELAASAGSVGGANVPANKRSFSRNKRLAQRAGRAGGAARINKEQESSCKPPEA